MLTLIKPDKTYRIKSSQWADAMNIYFQSGDKEELTLVVNHKPEYYSLSVTNPRLIAVNCLVNFTVIHSEVLVKALFADETYYPLRLETGQLPEPDLTPGEITLLSYFYLNPLPFSTSLIARWFNDIGTAMQRASDLADAVYMARVNKGETDPWFLQDFVDQENPEEIISKKLQNWHYPEKAADVFDLLHKYQELQFSFDYPGNPEKSMPVVCLNMIDESGFLVEDHAVIIAGLSVTITEFSKLAEVKWPLFTEAMLNRIPLYRRDFYSVGRLVAEYPEIFNLLISEYRCTIDIVCIYENGTKSAVNIENLRLDNITLSINSGIPVFMNIRK